jgi:catechol 2,3-dioxygenase-like lactoylglutathione lyase family enzyme
VLGLSVYGRAAGRHVFFTCGSQMLLVFNAGETERVGAASKIAVPVHGARGPGHVCFRASAAEIGWWRGHLLSAGIAIEAEVTWPGGGHSIYFRDPAGNSLEFAESRIWGLP